MNSGEFLILSTAKSQIWGKVDKGRPENVKSLTHYESTNNIGSCYLLLLLKKKLYFF
jgi:hypothetical protein